MKQVANIYIFYFFPFSALRFWTQSSRSFLQRAPQIPLDNFDKFLVYYIYFGFTHGYVHRLACDKWARCTFFRQSNPQWRRKHRPARLRRTWWNPCFQGELPLCARETQKRWRHFAYYYYLNTFWVSYQRVQLHQTIIDSSKKVGPKRDTAECCYKNRLFDIFYS